jgi:hypothetical protein
MARSGITSRARVAPRGATQATRAPPPFHRSPPSLPSPPPGAAAGQSPRGSRRRRVLLPRARGPPAGASRRPGRRAAHGGVYAGAAAPGFFGGGRRLRWLCGQRGGRSSGKQRGRSCGPCGQIWARAGRIWALRARAGVCGGVRCWSSAGRRSGGSGPRCLRPAALGGFPARAAVDSEPLATDLARGAVVRSSAGRSGISPDLGSSPSPSVALVPGGVIFG